MLEDTNTATLESSSAMDTVMVSRELFERLQGELKFSQARIAALNFEVARLKKWRFGSSSESLDASTQAVLFEQILVDTALEDAAAKEATKPVSGTPRTKGQAVRQSLPQNLPRIEYRYEIEETHCGCGHAFKRIGEEVSEQLDCVPAQFFVLRHIRGKYACTCCQTIQAAAMPAQMIDKGIPAPGLLAQVAVAKLDDHLPLYRQSEIYARSGVHIARSSMAQWLGIAGVRLLPLALALRDYILENPVVHADETPVALLVPGRGKTKKAYVWVYRTTNFVPQRAVYYDFCTSRGAEHPNRVFKGFEGTIVTDAYIGYHALHNKDGITAALCMAHARRHLFEAHKFNASPIAEHALRLIAELYGVERETHDLDALARLELRQSRSKPIAQELHDWLKEKRQLLAKSDVTAKAIDYSLCNWSSLTHFLSDGNVPIDNNAVENSVRPLALGRRNWLFVGSQHAGERAASILSLIESAKLNGHDPWAYLKDVFERLPTLLNKDLATLLPHNWQAPEKTPTPAPVPAVA